MNALNVERHKHFEMAGIHNNATHKKLQVIYFLSFFCNNNLTFAYPVGIEAIK